MNRIVHVSFDPFPNRKRHGFCMIASLSTVAEYYGMRHRDQQRIVAEFNAGAQRAFFESDFQDIRYIVRPYKGPALD